MSGHIARRGIAHNIIAPRDTIRWITGQHRAAYGGRSFYNPNAKINVVGAQTLVARSELVAPLMLSQDYWVVDEAHHLAPRENTWGQAVALMPNARGLGVTATPQRADGAGLGRYADGIADSLVIGLTMRELIDIGALSEYEIAIPQSDFEIDENAITDSGDFSTKKMREASKRSHIVGDVVTEYLKYASGKRAICFATDVETSGEIAENFNASGIAAVSISAKTPSEVRADFIRRFKAGTIHVLVNVDLFGEGFDVPACEVVIMARPTASLAVYLQQFGRALRVIEGKKYGLIIDHVSNVKRHGLPDKGRLWTLDRRDKRAKREKDPEEIPLTACRACSKPYESVLPSCPHCGNVPEVLPQNRQSIEKIDGDLILLDREKLAEMRAAVNLESPASVGARVFHAAGERAAKSAVENQIERIQTQKLLSDKIATWAAIQRFKKRSDQESYRRFYHAAGVDVLTALTLPRVEMQVLIEKIEGWTK
jgi:superfamily II DNA or RNA helicase